MSTPTDTTTPEDQNQQPERQGPEVPQPDKHGWVHIGHDPIEDDGPVAVPNCGNPCYQVVH